MKVLEMVVRLVALAESGLARLLGRNYRIRNRILLGIVTGCHWVCDWCADRRWWWMFDIANWVANHSALLCDSITPEQRARYWSKLRFRTARL